MTKKKIAIISIIVVLIIAIAGGCYFAFGQTETLKLTEAEAEKFVNETFATIADDGTRLEKPAEYVAQNGHIAVKKLTYSEDDLIVLNCTLTTFDVHSVVAPHYDSFLNTSLVNEKTNQVKSSLNLQQEFRENIMELVKTAPETTQDITLFVYNVDGKPVLYTSDEVVNVVFGGMCDIKADIDAKTTYTTVDEDGNEVVKALDSANDNIRKGFNECFELRYSSEKPDTSGPIGRFINGIVKDFKLNFIKHDRWKTIFNGLWVTIQITFLALIIGVFLGLIIAFIRFTYIKKKKRGLVLKFLNMISQIYLTVLRGTPVVVQILIIHFVILQPMGVNAFVSAFICFGINSGAYVAEIVRSGIMSIDEGQTEAGRSLGLSYSQTMMYIIAPQALKNVLPALANEFVVLLKETSIAFYIGIGDLMYSVNAIRAATYSPFMPLIASAIIYLVMVLFFSKLVSILERRMRNSER